MTLNSELMSRREHAVPRGVAHACGIFPDRALGSEIWDVEGRRYIDFAGGIAVLNVGHLHPKVVEAVDRQMHRFTHTSFQVMPYASYVELAERLNALAPGDDPKKTVFLTTGAEAVENAVKIARAHTGRPGVITFGGGFHGRTLLTLAMTGKVAPYKTGFGPFPADVYHVPFPMPYHGIQTKDTLRALDQLFTSDVEPERIAAIVIEPVLGEGGFYAAPTDLLQHLRALCDTHGIVLVADEIQSGFGRTGRMFAIEHSGVVPDLITVAKSLAAGFPLAGVIGKATIMDAPAPGGLGGTYGGNPVACAAALAVLDVIEEERLLERSTAMGERLANAFHAMGEGKGFRCIGEVRHLGAMCAVELVDDLETRAPAPALARALTQRALANGLIILSCGVYGNVVRILVPLTATDALVNEGIEVFRHSLAEVIQQT